MEKARQAELTLMESKVDEAQLSATLEHLRAYLAHQGVGADEVERRVAAHEEQARSWDPGDDE